jgi:hypothetical protein
MLVQFLTLTVLGAILQDNVTEEMVVPA